MRKNPGRFLYILLIVSANLFYVLQAFGTQICDTRYKARLLYPKEGFLIWRRAEVAVRAGGVGSRLYCPAKIGDTNATWLLLPDVNGSECRYVTIAQGEQLRFPGLLLNISPKGDANRRCVLEVAPAAIPVRQMPANSVLDSDNSLPVSVDLMPIYRVAVYLAAFGAGFFGVRLWRRRRQKREGRKDAH